MRDIIQDMTFEYRVLFPCYLLTTVAGLAIAVGSLIHRAPLTGALSALLIGCGAWGVYSSKKMLKSLAELRSRKRG